jgi:hypothetical protein
LVLGDRVQGSGDRIQGIGFRGQGTERRAICCIYVYI